MQEPRRTPARGHKKCPTHAYATGNKKQKGGDNLPTDSWQLGYPDFMPDPWLCAPSLPTVCPLQDSTKLVTNPRHLQ